MILLQLQESQGRGGSVAREITKVYIFMEGDRKYNVDVMVSLLRARLFDMGEIDTFLAKVVEGRVPRLVDFTENILRLSLFSEPIATALLPIEFAQTIDALTGLARLPGASPGVGLLLDTIRTAVKNQQQRNVLVVANGGSTKDKPQQSAPLTNKDAGSASAGGAIDDDHPAGLRESVCVLFEDWLRITVPGGAATRGDKPAVTFIARLIQQGMLRTDEVSARFFKIYTECAIRGASVSGEGDGGGVNYIGVDAFAKLIIVLLKNFSETTKMALLTKVLTSIIGVLARDHDQNKHMFNQKPYFRLICNLLCEVHATEETFHAQLYTAFSLALHQLRPALFPGFAFAWLELVSHRCFMPKLLVMKTPKSWGMLERLLVDLLAYIAPFMRMEVEVNDALRVLYKGTLRVLLVLVRMRGIK